MKDNMFDQDVEVENLPPSEKILKKSYDLHSSFVEKNWDNKESFHNQEHIEAVALAADRLISSAEFGSDPLDIQKSIDQWNAEHPDSQIKNMKQFKTIARIAFAAHDWGNIMEDLDVVDGEVIPQYLDDYTAKGAELRSQAMLEKFINAQDDITDDEKQVYINVGKELIWQTVYINPEDPNNEKPFAKFVRVCDQIGNDAFSKNDDRVEGLLAEMANENPDAEVNPYKFFNFGRNRIKEIITGDDKNEKISEIYKIWGKPVPDERDFYIDEVVNVGDALEAVKTAKKAKAIINKHNGLTAAAEREIVEAGYGEVLNKVMRNWEEIAAKN